MWSWYLNVTYKQTYGQTNRQTTHYGITALRALRIASRGKKYYMDCWLCICMQCFTGSAVGWQLATLAWRRSTKSLIAASRKSDSSSEITTDEHISVRKLKHSIAPLICLSHHQWSFVSCTYKPYASGHTHLIPAEPFERGRPAIARGRYS